MIFVAGLRPGHVFQFWKKNKTLSLPRLMVTEEMHALSHFEDIQGTHGMPPFQMPYLLLAFGNLPHSISVFKAQDFNQSPVFLIQAPKSPCCGAVIVIQYNFPMDHLKSVWKDAPAITRSFTVIPLVLHIAGWRWFQQLKLGA